jgi:hypothetical protein
VLLACQKEIRKPSEKYKTEFLAAIGDTAKVTVKHENVRKEPNGQILGTLKKAEQIIISGRIGNWLQFNSPRYRETYIWAPSLGFPYLNAYSPFFYYDSIKSSFYPINYFQTIFAQEGEKQNETSESYEIFFEDIGFGSHQETVLELMNESKEVVRHGIILYVKNPTNEIQKVRVDFFSPVNGYQSALKKCDIPAPDIVEQNGGHLIWPEGTLLRDLTVDLERKVWESNLFSSVWYW